MQDIHVILDQHKATLLASPGCVAVAIGKKLIGGEPTATDCIVVFVRKKGPVPASIAVPAQLAGVPTDVVERNFQFNPIATAPFARFDPLISGVSLTSWEDPHSHGSIGCFIDANGTMPNVPAGRYLLTNQHVVQVAATGGDTRVIQPGNVPPPCPPPFPANYLVGAYVHGLRDADHDCAIVHVQGRNVTNQVPNHPWCPGRRKLAGIAVAAVNDRVYKYGSTTQHTTGIVTNINFSTPGITNAILVQGENNGPWCDGGDSGSVMIRYADDHVMGLLFRADTTTPVTGGFREGLVYDIATQFQVFGGALAQV